MAGVIVIMRKEEIPLKLYPCHLILRKRKYAEQLKELEEQELKANKKDD